MTPAPPAIPRLEENGLIPPVELVGIERAWGRFRVIARLLAHIRVLHYRYEALKAWAQAIDPEAYCNKFGSD